MLEPRVPGMNSLPLVCERGGQGERAPLSVCAPARSGALLSGHALPAWPLGPARQSVIQALGVTGRSTVLGTPLGSGCHAS